jgi:hypothetical protein
VSKYILSVRAAAAGYGWGKNQSLNLSSPFFLSLFSDISSSFFLSFSFLLDLCPFLSHLSSSSLSLSLFLSPDERKNERTPLAAARDLFRRLLLQPTTWNILLPYSCPRGRKEGTKTTAVTSKERRRRRKRRKNKCSRDKIVSLSSSLSLSLSPSLSLSFSLSLERSVSSFPPARRCILMTAGATTTSS